MSKKPLYRHSQDHQKESLLYSENPNPDKHTFYIDQIKMLFEDTT